MGEVSHLQIAFLYWGLCCVSYYSKPGINHEPTGLYLFYPMTFTPIQQESTEV